MNAKAAVFTGVKKPFAIREYPVTPPAAGYAMLSLAASGVCGTDVHFHNGVIPLEPPKIIGHEFVGRVEEISAEDSAKCGIKAGDYAIVDIAIPCGKCKLCKEGDDANCVNMGVTNGGDPNVAPHFHGGFCEVSYAPVSNLIKLPEGVDPLAACVFACPGPTVLHAFRLAKQADCHIENAELAVVQGNGPVGCMAVACLAEMGVKNIVVLTNRVSKDADERTEKLGATKTIHMGDLSDEEIVAEITKISPLGADVVFEASGSPAAVPTGFAMLRNRGVYLVPGQYSNSGGIEIQPQLITFKALHIIGSSQYSICDVDAYVKMLADNPDLQSCIRDLATCYPVSDINQAFADAKARKNIKTVLVK